MSRKKQIILRWDDVLGRVSDPLGINTKSSSPSNCEKPEKELLNQTRTQRFKLARTARAIYARAGEKAGFEYVLNYHRTALCHYANFADVQVNVAYEYHRAFLTGVVACGCVHTCPVCAAKIEERRRVEISNAVDFWYSLPGKSVAMITFTFSHAVDDSLPILLKKQAYALELLRSGKSWTNFTKVFGFDSLIRSFELTFSEDNGFHPHTHELWCLDKIPSRSVVLDYLKYKYRAKKHGVLLRHLMSLSTKDIFVFLLKQRWLNCCTKAGLMTKPTGAPVDVNDFLKRSVNVRFGVSAGDYLAKQDDSRHWGVDREMSRASTKIGRKSGVHPFAFLRKFSETGSGIWASRWLDYSKAVSKKRRLYWSQGLKSRVGLNDLTDEEIAAKSDEYSYTVYSLTLPEWHKARMNIPAILQAAEESQNLSLVIQSLTELPFFTSFDVTLPPENSVKLDFIVYEKTPSKLDFYKSFTVSYAHKQAVFVF